MSLQPIAVEQALAAPGAYDTLIDVRSPAEFAEDHLPGAVNWPVLDDEERHHVGTLYVQVSPLEARKVGAALVSRRIAALLEQHVIDKPRDWRPLVYCWRGGQRSGSLGLVLGQIGFRTGQLAGGYKAFRAQVRADLEVLPTRFDYRVLWGRTGSGKTRLLAALADAGAQALDLEDLAAHRGSVLGALPDRPQPTQKRFETLVWHRLRQFDPAQPVWVESESRKIGQRQLPDALLNSLRQAAAIFKVELPMPERIALLLEDYAFFTEDVERLCQQLQTLTDLRGKEALSRWQMQARDGDWPTLLVDLMTRHYDPLYDKSMNSHFDHAPQARTLRLQDACGQTLSDVARTALGADATGRG
jgi:tRNA 2-selenouridine synthase